MSKEKGPQTSDHKHVTREVEIQNPYGMHARPAAMFVKTAAKFGSDITVENKGVVVSGKSIMGLLTLEGYQGAVLKITAVGPDAEEAINAIQKLVETEFSID